MLRMIEKLFVLAICMASLGVSYGFYYNDSALITGIKTNEKLRNFLTLFRYNETIDFLRLLTESDSIAPNCKNSLKRWISGIERNEVWAWKFLQSTGKSVDGKLVGRDLNLGSFQFCTTFYRDEDSGIDFDGKYCLVSLQGKDAEEVRNSEGYTAFKLQISERSQRLFEFGMGSAHGVCMPSTCDVHEITQVFNRQMKPHGFRVQPAGRCTTISEPEPVTILQIVAILILGSFVVLCLLACFFENEFLSNFSVARNFDVIYSIKPDSNNNPMDESTAFLHGIKFALIVGSVVMHNIGFPLALFFPQAWSSGKEKPFYFWFEGIFSRLYLVPEGMFFLGGFFAFWSWHEVSKRGKAKLNFLTFFAARYAKVFVIVTLIILFTIILPLLGTGPYYSQVTNHFLENCKANFWREYLLISNLQSVVDMCIIPSWFLAADFHVYLMNFFVIKYLIINPKIGFLIAFLQSAVISSFTIYYVYSNQIVSFFNVMDITVEDNRLFQDYYLPSFYHYNATLIGIIGAYLIKNRIKPKILDNAIVRYALLVVLAGSFFMFLQYLDYIEKVGFDPESYFIFFLPIFDRLANLVWVYYLLFYLCMMGYLAPLRKLFSFRFYVPWSRLSFTLIMGQFLYLIYSAGYTRNPFSLDRVTFVKESCGALVITFLIGNFISLTMEQPIFNLMQNYLGIKRRSKMRPKTNQSSGAKSEETKSDVIKSVDQSRA